VLLEAERWRQLRLHALEALSRRLTGVRRFADALEAGMAAVRGEPLRESGHIAVMLVHLAEGNQCEAVAEFERYRALLGTELGLEPTENITGLVRTLRRQ
jgi:DNA-binding SARP family transcriptional activator